MANVLVKGEVGNSIGVGGVPSPEEDMPQDCQFRPIHVEVGQVVETTAVDTLGQGTDKAEIGDGTWKTEYVDYRRAYSVR